MRQKKRRVRKLGKVEVASFASLTALGVVGSASLLAPGDGTPAVDDGLAPIATFDVPAARGFRVEVVDIVADRSKRKRIGDPGPAREAKPSSTPSGPVATEEWLEAYGLGPGQQLTVGEETLVLPREVSWLRSKSGAGRRMMEFPLPNGQTLSLLRSSTDRNYLRYRRQGWVETAPGSWESVEEVTTRTKREGQEAWEARITQRADELFEQAKNEDGKNPMRGQARRDAVFQLLSEGDGPKSDNFLTGYNIIRGHLGTLGWRTELGNPPPR